MTKMISEIKSASAEMKRSIEIDMMLRRYQKSLQGELTWGEHFKAIMSSARNTLATSWRSIIKRGLDVVASVFGLIIVAPVMAVVAIAIKLNSKGPIFYSQTRVGSKGKLFNILKFRTMRQDAESASGPMWAQKNDPRVTTIGNFLRKTHLDELPQLFNVIRGEMSLVGPRPERPYFVSEFTKMIPHYQKRLQTKPGITGLAQVRRRYDETMEDVKKKVRYDRLYIEKMCPLLDVKVLLLTVGTVVFGTGR